MIKKKKKKTYLRNTSPIVRMPGRANSPNSGEKEKGEKKMREREIYKEKYKYCGTHIIGRD